jgi:hypothetical protein
MHAEWQEQKATQVAPIRDRANDNRHNPLRGGALVERGSRGGAGAEPVPIVGAEGKPGQGVTLKIR